MDLLYIFKAIIIAIVEGITEFIPVSSTGHMILAGWAIDFKGEFPDMFEVVIQLGAILAVVVLYWKKIFNSIIQFLKYLFGEKNENRIGFQFGINIIVASIPMGIVGLLCYKQIKLMFRPEAVMFGFIFGGILLLFIEKLFRNKKGKVEDIDYVRPLQAFCVGVFQLLALWPGMSRSASSIMGGWISGLSTPVAAEFSFFIAIPAMIGTSAKDLLEFNYNIMTTTMWVSLIIGFFISFIVALIVIRNFINYLKKKPMKVFAVYRVVVGILLVILVLNNIIKLTN